MHIKVYFQDKPLYLTDEINAEIEPYVHHDDSVFMDELSTPAINSILHEMRQQKVHAGVFINKDFEELKKSVFKKFTIIFTAGGLVLNEKNNLLMIHRRGKWDLPKGKLDPGESFEKCAVREVKEETGLKEVKLEKPLLITYHTYDENGKHILKETHWYCMRAPGYQDLIPQEEEQITKLVWVEEKDLVKYTGNTYPLIIDVLDAAGFLQKVRWQN